jgi:predicted CopG family antitoxin
MTEVMTWPGRAEMWLDERGKWAWIAAMVIGFIVFWPIGLALLAYMIWGKRMFGRSCAARGRNAMHMGGFRSSGNSAFDAYKAETLRRLEDEQEAFSSFLKRLREAKDKTEFDAFMDERARARADEARRSDPAD